jgi:hypothetical protein
MSERSFIVHKSSFIISDVLFILAPKVVKEAVFGIEIINEIK